MKDLTCTSSGGGRWWSRSPQFDDCCRNNVKLGFDFSSSYLYILGRRALVEPCLMYLVERFRFWVLGFGLWVLGFGLWVCGLMSKVQGFGLRKWASVFRVSGLWCTVVG